MKIKQKRLKEIIQEEIDRFEKEKSFISFAELVQNLGSDVVLNELAKSVPKEKLEEVIQILNGKFVEIVGDKVKHLKK